MLVSFFKSFYSKINARRQLNKIEVLRRSLIVYAVIFVLWGLYRMLLRFPAELEEVFLKPLVFLLPLVFVFKREKVLEKEMFKVLGFGEKNIFFSVYLGFTLGVAFILVTVLGRAAADKTFISVSSISYSALVSLTLLSLSTALWEQVVFSGFLLVRFFRVFGDEWSSAGLTAFLFTLLHLPVLMLENQVQPVFIAVQMLLLFLVGFGNSVLMLRTRNILAPILSHTFWALSFGLLA